MNFNNINFIFFFFQKNKVKSIVHFYKSMHKWEEKRREERKKKKEKKSKEQENSRNGSLFIPRTQMSAFFGKGLLKNTAYRQFKNAVKNFLIQSAL